MDELVSYERRFRHAGLPLLIEDYSAREDVYTRALPILTLVFVAELLGAIDLDWSIWGNMLAIAGGISFVLAGFGLVNVARRRPFFSIPERVGTVELAVFVLLPALLPAIFGLQTTSALVTASANLLLLGVVYLVVGFGFLSIVRWAASRVVSELANSVLLLARALPLLMIFSVVLFLTVEMWQVFGLLPAEFLATLLVMFVALGTTFLLVRLPREVERLEREAGESGPPLGTLQRVNVGLVLVVSHALQVLVVSIAIGAFFVVFGALAITPETMTDWIGDPGKQLITVSLYGKDVVVTEELLRVAGAIAAFSGLYYAIAVLTDSTYREEFLEEITSEMRETFRQRARYLELRRA
jgi:hypothetical protein